MMPENLRTLVDRVGRGRSALVLGVGVLALIALLGISRWATAAAKVPLLPGLGVDGVAEVTAKLDEQGVAYELAKGGSEILVDEAEFARARVLLAREGLPAKGRPGFELFDQPSWGMTDFTQRINYRRALEGELERTIGQMRHVEGAQVHLAIGQSQAFRRQENPEAASVVLRLQSGARPGADLVEGISSLVASSVDGLDSDKVTVLDDAGRLLSAAVEPGDVGGLTKKQLGLRRDVEGYLESKAEDLVGQVVGPGNVRVRVAADLNFDKLDRTVQTVDPDQTITLKEERSEIVPGEGQVGAGTSAESATYEASRTLEQFSGAAGSISRLTVAVLVNEGTPQAADGAPEGGTPAPLLSPEQLTRIEALVRNAVGIDATRGDDITVVSIPFDVVNAPVAVEEGPGILQQLPQYQRPIITIFALLLAFVLALKTLRAVRPQVIELPRQEEQPVLPAGESDGGEVEAALMAAAPQPAFAGAEHAHVLARSAQTPDMAARVIRAWMKES
jgi:flagellar M-ring protein FliF